MLRIVNCDGDADIDDDSDEFNGEHHGDRLFFYILNFRYGVR